MPILLAHGSTPPQVALYKRMAAIGCELRVVADADEGVGLLREGAGDALLLHVDAPTLAALSTLSPAERARVILLAERMTADALRGLSDLQVGALLAKNGLFGAEELLGAALKHLKGDLFGPEKYLAWGTQVHRQVLTESIHRGTALDGLEQFLTQLGLDQRLIGQTLTMADELLTNAFYNAPVDERGRRRYAHLSRIEPVVCPPDRPVELCWACDGTLFAVSVRDSYGTLEPGRVIVQVANALAGQAAVQFGEGGAGIGLVTAFNAASQLVFNLSMTRASECIGLMEIGSYKRYLEQGKSVHLFSLFNSERRE